MNKALIFFVSCLLILSPWGLTLYAWNVLTIMNFIIAPIQLVLAFGVYAVVTVLYRTFTFKNCPEAAEELQRQIKEAKTYLKKNGIIE